MPGAECIDREETAVGLQGVPATAVIETVDKRVGHNTVCYRQQSGHNTVSKQQEITAFVVS